MSVPIVTKIVAIKKSRQRLGLLFPFNGEKIDFYHLSPGLLKANPAATAAIGDISSI